MKYKRKEHTTFGVLFCNGILFGEVNVIIDVVFAEAVVAFAAGAITEFKIGIVSVGAATYGALAGISLALGFGMCLLCCFFEIDNVGAALIAVSAAYRTYNICQHISAEYEVIQNCCKGNESEEYLTCDQTRYDSDDEKRGINICQPLYFYGDNEEQQYAALGEESGEHKEHRKVNVGRIEENVTLLAEKSCYHSVHYRA